MGDSFAGYPINPIRRAVAISVVAGVVLIVAVTSIASAVVYTRLVYIQQSLHFPVCL